MTVERALRLIAGAFVMLSVLLGIYVNVNFLWFTLFVGANLFQSAFTNWCPMMVILRKGGLTDAGYSRAGAERKATQGRRAKSDVMCRWSVGA